MNKKQQVIELLKSFKTDTQLADQIDAIYRSEGMIKREDIKDAYMDAETGKDGWNNIYELIQAEREQYAELVDGVRKTLILGYIQPGLKEAYQATVTPPPSIADRLDALAEEEYERFGDTSTYIELRAIAKELREREGE